MWLALFAVMALMVAAACGIVIVRAHRDEERHLRRQIEITRAQLGAETRTEAMARDPRAAVAENNLRLAAAAKRVRYVATLAPQQVDTKTVVGFNGYGRTYETHMTSNPNKGLYDR